MKKVKANLDIREILKSVDITQWELANKLNISETTLVRKLRKELPEDEKQEILKMILEIKKGE